MSRPEGGDASSVGRGVSDRPAFGTDDDIRFERKPPDLNLLDRDYIVDSLKRWGVVIVFALVVVTFALLSPETFLSTRNAVNVLNNSSVLMLFATAATLALVIGEFDLSFPAVADLVAVLAGVLVTTFGWVSGFGIVGAIAAGIAVGTSIGLINGVFIAKAFVPSFVTTLAVGSIAAGAELAAQAWIPGGAKQLSQIVLPAPIQWLGSVTLGATGIKGTVVLAASVAVLTWLLLRRTVPGRRAYAIGGNPMAAYLAGVPVLWLRVGAFALIGAIAALGGLITLSERGYFNAGSPPLLLQAYAAAFLGAAVFAKKRRFDVFGTVVAVFLLLVLNNGLSLMNQPRWIGSAISGAVLLAAVVANRPKGREV